MKFHRFVWLTLFSIYLIILAGSLVRMSGSGMGCPDWPKCFGYLIPPTSEDQVQWEPNRSYKKGQMILHEGELLEAEDYFVTALEFNGNNWLRYDKHDYAKFNVQHTWTEYINRLASVLAGILAIIQLIWSVVSWLKRKLSWQVPLFAFLLLILFGVQAWLGKVVVDSNLAPLKITVHMFGALAIVALQLLILRNVKPIIKMLKVKPVTKLLIWAAFIVLLVQTYLGTQVRQQVDVIAKEIGFTERGAWLENLGRIFEIHRSFMWVLLAAVIGLLYFFRKGGRTPAWLKWTTLFVVLEALAGIILARFNFPAAAQPVHLLLASILFGTLLWGLITTKQSGRIDVS